MTEAKDSLRSDSIQTERGGELVEQWESDSLGDQHRDIDKLRAQKRRERLPKTVTQPPGNPASIKPMNDVMLRPDAKGRYRIVDQQGKVHPLPSKTR